MSVQSSQNNLVRVENDIAKLEKQFADETKKEADKLKRANQIERSITKNTSESSLRSKQSQLVRIQSDLSKIGKKKADVSKKIADKKAQKGRYQQQYDRDLKYERSRIESAERRRREDELRHQQMITQEIAKQKELSQSIPKATKTNDDNPSFDFFISHASEDKENFVRPLADKLTELNISVWYDEFQLKIGDSLRRSIDSGLSNSKYGIVVLSVAFLKKNWTQYELDGLVSREMNGVKVILPIWHKISKDEVQSYSPTLADKVALNSSMMCVNEIANELKQLIEE